MHHKTFFTTASATLALAFSLSGCGGGGGGETASAAAPPPTAPAATVASLLPGAAMSWATAGEKTIALTVQAADGLPAAGAAVRVFTLSRLSPQDGSSLDEPVPQSLLDTVVSDAAGRAQLTLLWPGHVEELLVVATLQDTHGSTVLAANGEAGLVLRLTR